MTRSGHSWRAPRRLSRSRHTDVRGLRYHLREWGEPGAPIILLLHGGRDASGTFQFLVDAMEGDWHFIAPDWRGHGLTDRAPGGYWLSDFVGDLDILFEELFADRAAIVAAHSMGANVASLFAGLRPEKVSRLVLLDALGNLLDLSPVPIVNTLLRMLNAPRPGRSIRPYPTVPAMAERLRRANPRLSEVQSEFLAEHLSRPLPAGGFVWAKDITFERAFPTLHDAAEWGQCWSRITAPVLSLLSTDDRAHAITSDPAEVSARAAYFRNISLAAISNTGHNLHHDAPHAVACAIEAFLRDEPVLECSGLEPVVVI
ncbi:alpha/beta hydrolase [Sphingomonas sp. BIUV-7]|uniref:Alpha/beta hydrolase n=1 Tax=Sphingomonas natans TaxID=3063330 RepID=A0ABT8Y6X1_9SPHN|nr:alpha/beta hydrolase [Sphingomonas sp. BIUV-7]MDO6414062.1 alpha/beta hydrolase [Sphingomonas sp. BIUV-7]